MTKKIKGAFSPYFDENLITFLQKVFLDYYAP